MLKPLWTKSGETLKLDLQEANFHSSTESEVVSFHAARRLDGLPALDLWDLVVEVLHSSLHEATSCAINTLKNIPTQEQRNSLTRQ